MLKKKHHNGNIFEEWIPVIILIVALAFVVVYGSIRDKVKNEKLQAMARKYNLNEQKRSQEEEQLKQKILQQIPGIVCWGDSLTAGAGGDGTSYPSVLQGLIKQNIYEIPVINMGVGGEDTNTILGRSGVAPFVANAFTIPSDLSEVNILLKSSNGRGVFPLRQNGTNNSDGGVNPVTIDGIEGTISIEQASSASKEFKYYFKRSSEDKTTSVPDGTPVITKATNLYNDYINIIFMGQNGGWTNPDDLISQQKLLISKLGKNKDKYLILGLTSYALIGNIVYKRMVELGYFDIIKDYAKELNKLNNDSQ